MFPSLKASFLDRRRASFNSRVSIAQRSSKRCPSVVWASTKQTFENAQEAQDTFINVSRRINISYVGLVPLVRTSKLEFFVRL